MKKTSGVAAATLVAMAVASPAFAADLLPVKAPVLVEVPSWTQWYIGGEVGGKWGKDDWTTTCLQKGAPLSVCGNALDLLQFPLGPDSSSPHSFTTSGVRAGVYVGATYQVAPSWVMGFEGDYAFSKASSTVQGIVGCSIDGCNSGVVPGGTPAFDSTSVKFGDDFSLRLRGGFLVTPDVLLYGTGGVAFQRVSVSASCNSLFSVACGFDHSQTFSKWLPGWTVGAGVEWKLFHNWLVRGEYRYADFGTYKPTIFQGSGDIEVLTNQKVTTQIATFGLAYSFPISK
jgi:outer membrane immunogenic protein